MAVQLRLWQLLLKVKSNNCSAAKKKFGEHVNDHQMQFVKITKEIYNLIVIDDISDLHLILHNFKDKHFETYLNNERFNVRFNVEISNLLKEIK